VEKPNLLAISVNLTQSVAPQPHSACVQRISPSWRSQAIGARTGKRYILAGTRGSLETRSQTSRLLSGLVSVLIVSSDAQAASLTLGCTGTVTTSNVPKEGVVPDPDKDNVSDYSVVVDLDRHAVFGFWFETPTTGMTVAQTALPITQAIATGIYFVARRKQSAIGESIYGSVDPITGAVSAMENKLYPSGNVQTTEWDLHCKPTRPL
jgi:hypothetical protein